MLFIIKDNVNIKKHRTQRSLKECSLHVNIQVNLNYVTGGRGRMPRAGWYAKRARVSLRELFLLVGNECIWLSDTSYGSLCTVVKNVKRKNIGIHTYV